MRSRTKRSKAKRKPILITDRDRYLFASLQSYRFLSTVQIFRLHFSSIHRTRKRLFQLWQHGFIKRIVRPVRLGEGSAPYFYVLTNKGAERVPLSESRDSSSAKRTVVSQELGEHTERINDVRIALELLPRHGYDLHVESWQQGYRLKMLAPVRVNGLLRQIPIVPDAFLSMRAGSRDYHYFLELDRGTTDLSRLAAKWAGYLHLWREKIAQERFAIRSFRVLYITTTEKRLQNMLAKLQSLHAIPGRLDLFSFGTFDVVSLSQPEQLLQPVWKSVTDEGSIASSCPLPSSSPTSLPTVPGKPPVR